MARPKKLKLFVWERVFCDWFCGIVCVLAYDEAQARKLCNETFDEYDRKELEGQKPKVVGRPTVFYSRGGG